MGKRAHILEPKITTSVLGVAIGLHHKENGSIVVVHASHGGVPNVGRFFLQFYIAGLRPPDTQRATLQTLNRELQPACPLSRISVSQRKEIVVSIHRRTTPRTVIRGTIQKTIHGLETRSDKFATEYYMKSIDCVNGYRCSCGHCQPMPSSREYVCCREIQVVEQKLQDSDVKLQCITEHNSFDPVCRNVWVLQTASSTISNMVTLSQGKQSSDLL